MDRVHRNLGKTGAGARAAEQEEESLVAFFIAFGVLLVVVVLAVVYRRHWRALMRALRPEFAHIFLALKRTFWLDSASRVQSSAVTPELGLPPVPGPPGARAAFERRSSLRTLSLGRKGTNVGLQQQHTGSVSILGSEASGGTFEGNPQSELRRTLTRKRSKSAPGFRPGRSGGAPASPSDICMRDSSGVSTAKSSEERLHLSATDMHAWRTLPHNLLAITSKSCTTEQTQPTGPPAGAHGSEETVPRWVRRPGSAIQNVPARPGSAAAARRPDPSALHAEPTIPPMGKLGPLALDIGQRPRSATRRPGTAGTAGAAQQSRPGTSNSNSRPRSATNDTSRRPEHGAEINPATQQLSMGSISRPGSALHATRDHGTGIPILTMYGRIPLPGQLNDPEERLPETTTAPSSRPQSALTNSRDRRHTIALTSRAIELDRQPARD